MTLPLRPGRTDAPGFWLDQDDHRDWLAADARRQLAFFQASARKSPGFHVLGYDGRPLPDTKQELHTTTRLVHSFALGKIAGFPNCDEIIDKGMDYLWSHHRDAQHGGYLWAIDGDDIADSRKLAYGHVFVLLAASSAQAAGHPDAKRLMADVWDVLDTYFWEDDRRLFADEWNRDWTPFSNYRGMNANMHGVEALLAAFEATDDRDFLNRAGDILNFFMREMAPAYDWRLPEHYTADWTVDAAYAGDPMFRPAGTTPGHSFELARLMVQHWDLAGRIDPFPEHARHVVDRALSNAWDAENGGIYYTLQFDGAPDVRDRYWWPVTEAIGVVAALQTVERSQTLENWYRTLWSFAAERFVDHELGGWFPEIGDDGRPRTTQFSGKPDLYHALQATLFPLSGGVSRYGTKVTNLLLT